MKRQKERIHAFTSRFTKKSLLLRNEIQISELYDPSDESKNPPRKSYTCLWDTGATGTVVTKNVVDELGLKPSGKITVQVVGPSDADAIHALRLVVNACQGKHRGIT